MTTNPRRVGNRWVFADGYSLPVVSGGDGPNDDAGGDDTTDDDDTTTAGDDDATTTDDDKSATDDDAAKWKKLSRQNEQAAKKLRRELDELRKKSMTDDDRALEDAKAAARAEVLAEVGAERVAAAFERALAGTDVDVDELVDGLNVAKFIDDDGHVDRDAVSAFVKRLGVTSSSSSSTKRPPVDMGQGARKPPATKGQLTRADMARMTPEQIVEADNAGRFDDLKAGRNQ